jgi:serine/threonine-protein kinase
LTARLIAGTEGATQQPFFSPDGKWIGYFSFGDRQLKKISINGGAPVTLCAVPQLLGAWWGKDDTIVYGQRFGDIMRISANGGTAEPLVKIKTENPAFPQILPDGKSLLYTLDRGTTGQGKIVVQSPKSGEPKELFAGGMARYLPTGHIIYRLQNNLFAIAFDADRLEVVGGPVPIVEGMSRAAVSDAGTLVYISATAMAAPEGAPTSGRTLVWVDRKGKEEPLGAPLNLYRFPKISPDGTRVAIAIVITGESTNTDIWVWDLVRKTLTRLTFEGMFNVSPVWTPDGKRIAFCQVGGIGSNVQGVYWKAADGSGKAEQLDTSSRGPFLPYNWSSDGKALIGAEMGMNPSLFDIEMLSMEGDHALKPLLRESYSESQPKISPDGRWMAYTSDESRKNEVYVRPFPEVNNGRWQISTNGGDSPLWSPDGRELFYRSGDSVMAVSVKTESSFNIVGTPQILFRGTYVQGTLLEGSPWDIHPDGKRFLMIKPPASTGASPAAALPRQKINIVLNWTEELKQRVPAK